MGSTNVRELLLELLLDLEPPKLNKPIIYYLCNVNPATGVVVIQTTPRAWIPVSAICKNDLSDLRLCRGNG